MKTRRPFRDQKRPVYVGCEGLSECGYMGVLQDILRVADAPIHLIVDELGPGAGDPLARVEMAVRRIGHIRRTRIAPVERFVLLDSDQTEISPERADRAVRLAGNHDITILWQRPCFEALLLRHLEGRTGHRPPDSPEALRALVRNWPGYEKPMTRAALSLRIDLSAMRRAATVEPELASLLRCLGLLE